MSKKPWPTKEVMDQIYEKKLWGGTDIDFYSGDGSHNPIITFPYIKKVVDFLNSFSNKISVCDLGCGDFNIGEKLLPYSKAFVAVDIVEKLIERNKRKYNADNLEFRCLDLAKDPLPKADCALLRQVLQHLSNTEVQLILDKLCQYQYIIITEHLPSFHFEPNLDIISGQGIRLKKKSGLDITKPPFQFDYGEKIELLSIDLEEKGSIMTNLFVRS